MGKAAIGSGNAKVPPFSKSYAAAQGAPVDLTEANAQKCAASGLLCIANATTVRLTYKDCAGNSVDTGSITTMVSGNTFRVDTGVTELTTNIGLIVIAFWHGV